MTKYLLEDFSAVDGKDVKHPTQAIVDESQIIKAIGEAHTNGVPIRVYKVGNCLLDWTKPATPTETVAP